ncbi:MAG: 50S ribosomal protein L11 methyltransferase [Chthoniobacterales bacterium]
MILWRKQASPEWLAAHQPRLEQITGNDLAIIARPGRTRSLVEVTCHRQAEAARMRREFGGIAQPLPRNWCKNAQARQSHSPIRVGRRLEVVSETARDRKWSDRIQLVIPAAGAFGTGEHATTAMSLRLLEDATRKLPAGWRLLDAGTGTGILALAAVRFGASHVLGLDNDARAVAHARRNARLNHIRTARFVRADVLAWRPELPYDFITANLFSELLIATLPIFRRALRLNGRLIASGILREQAPEVVYALRRSGFHIAKQRRRGKWIALLCTRPSHCLRLQLRHNR